MELEDPTERWCARHRRPLAVPGTGEGEQLGAGTSATLLGLGNIGHPLLLTSGTDGKGC